MISAAVQHGPPDGSKAKITASTDLTARLTQPTQVPARHRPTGYRPPARPIWLEAHCMRPTILVPSGCDAKTAAAWTHFRSHGQRREHCQYGQAVGHADAVDADYEPDYIRLLFLISHLYCALSGMRDGLTPQGIPARHQWCRLTKGRVSSRPSAVWASRPVRAGSEARWNHPGTAG